MASDDAHSVQAAEVAEDEGVAAFGVVGCALGKPEVPGAVLEPGVGLEVASAGGGAGLHVAPAAAQDVAAGVDQLAGVLHPGFVDRVLRHRAMVAHSGRPRSAGDSAAVRTASR